VRITWSTSSSDQTRASSRVASPKRELIAAISVPLIAPAEAPVTIGKGDGPSRNAGSSPIALQDPRLIGAARSTRRQNETQHRIAPGPSGVRARSV
jgi:hypothetical protein